MAKKRGIRRIKYVSVGPSRRRRRRSRRNPGVDVKTVALVGGGLLLAYLLYTKLTQPTVVVAAPPPSSNTFADIIVGGIRSLLAPKPKAPPALVSQGARSSFFNDAVQSGAAVTPAVAMSGLGGLGGFGGILRSNGFGSLS